MSSQNTIRTGRNLGPLIEALQQPQQLKSGVSPELAGRTYTEKQPDYIARPSFGSGKYAQLSQALSAYVPALNNMAAVAEERSSKAADAIGQRRFQLEENKVAWKAFTEKYPEHSGDNPHVERGYKRAHLEYLALNYATHMQDLYTKTLAGETDPDKVKAALDNAGVEWIRGNVPAEYLGTDDPDLYAEGFYKPTTTALASLMARHSGDKAAEHLRRNAETYSTLIGGVLDAGFHNTPGLGNPETLTNFIQGKGQELSALMQRMIDEGTPATVAHEVFEKSVFAYAASLGGEGSGALGPQALKFLDHITTSDGQPLSAKPATQATKERQLKTWRDERRSNMEYYERQKERQYTKGRRETLRAVMGRLGEDLEGGRPPTSDTDLLALPGVHKDHWDVVKEAQAIYIGLRNQRLELDPEAQREAMLYRLKAMRGELSHDDTLPLAGRFGLDYQKELQNLIVNAESGNDPVSRVMKGIDLSRAFRMAQTQLMAGGGGGSGGIDPEALQTATEEVMAYSLQGLEEYVKEMSASGGKTPSPWEANKYLHNIILEAGKNPAFRGLKKPHDIRRTEEILQRYPDVKQIYENASNPTYDMAGRVQELLNSPPFPKTTEGKHKTERLIAEYLAKPEETGRNIAQEYGVSIADVPGLVENWSLTMLGFPLNEYAKNWAAKGIQRSIRDRAVKHAVPGSW